MTGPRGSGSRCSSATISSISPSAPGSAATRPGADVAQNQRNYAWRDYGNRVGIWYYLDLLDEFGLPGAHNVNSAVLEYCPDIVERLNGRGDEYVGHGRTNSERQDVLWEEDEARLIAECTEIVDPAVRQEAARAGSARISAQSGVTLDLLKEAGYRYVMDWALDDQPIWMRTRSGPILSVPYPIEMQRLAGAGLPPPHRPAIRRDGRSTSSTRCSTSRGNTRWCSRVALHPFIIGQPFRLRAFRAPCGTSWRIATNVDHHPRRDRPLLREPAARDRAGELIRNDCEAIPTMPGAATKRGVRCRRPR